MNKKEIYESQLIKPVVRIGMLTNLLACAGAFVPAIYLMIVYGAVPPVAAVIQGATATILGFSLVFWIVEPISYFPILGIPGTYMGFLSGNISNMRVPCSIQAQTSDKVEERTPEGSIISVLGVGMSIIVNVIVMTIGAFAGAAIISACPPAITRAFDFILPAVFGGVFGQFAPKNFKIAVFALALGCATFIVKIIPTYVAIPLCIFVTIFVGITMHNRSEKKAAE